MSIPKIWEEDFRILSFHMDPTQKAHLTTICNFLQEAAGAHASAAGFGYEDMLKRKQVWVLSRLKLIVDHYPNWREHVKLKTWSRGQDGIFYIRDFTIDDEKGQTIIKATSSWAAINVESRRPEIVDGLEEGLYSMRDTVAIKEKLGKLSDLENPVLIRKRKVEYTDIDLIYHVNNVKYIELIYNSFPAEILLNKKVKSLEMNYLDEAKFGEDVLVSFDKKEENTFLVSVERELDRKQVCKAKIVWQA
jgi:acyl-ACP thioesterase